METWWPNCLCRPSEFRITLNIPDRWNIGAISVLYVLQFTWLEGRKKWSFTNLIFFGILRGPKHWTLNNNLSNITNSGKLLSPAKHYTCASAANALLSRHPLFLDCHVTAQVYSVFIHPTKKTWPTCRAAASPLTPGKYSFITGK